MKLEQFVRYFPWTHLAAAAGELGLPKGSRVEQIIPHILGTLTSDEGLRMAWERLGPEGRQIVAHAVHAGGQFERLSYEARYGRLKVRSPLRWGTVGRVNLLDLFLPYGTVADELLARLEPMSPRPEPYKVPATHDIPLTMKLGSKLGKYHQANTEQVGVRDLAAFLRLVDEGGLQYAKTGQLGAAGSTRALGVLSEHDYFPQAEAGSPNDPIRPQGLATFAAGGGLVELPEHRTGAVKAQLSAAGRQWLRTRDPELLLAAFEKWTSEGEFDELARLEFIKGQRAGGTRLTEPGSRRERVIEALSWCPVGLWIDVEDFFRAVLIWQFDFDVEEGLHGSLRLIDQTWQWLGDGYWRLVACQYMLVVLWECLASLGALDIVYSLPADAGFDSGMPGPRLPFYSRYDGLKYLRINPLGAYLLGQSNTYSPGPRPLQPLLKIEPAPSAPHEFLINVLDSDQVTPADVRTVREIAEPGGDGTYRMTLASLLATLQTGRDLRPYGEFLARWHAGPLPAEFAGLIEEAIHRGEAFSAPQTALVYEVESGELARMVTQDAKARRMCYLVGERTIIVTSKRAAAFRTRLRELGYILKS